MQLLWLRAVELNGLLSQSRVSKRRWPRRCRGALLAVSIAIGGAFLLSGCEFSGAPLGPEYTSVEFTTVGAPLDRFGNVSPLEARVRVFDAAGEPLRFTGDLTADPRGLLEWVTLPRGSSSGRLRLRRNQNYVFVTAAFDENGDQLAVAENRLFVGSKATALVIRLRTLLGSARLAPRLPVTKLVPGQVLDLVFSVSPNAREDLRVPPGDFDVVYSGSAEVIEFSTRGARVRIGSREAGDAIVVAVANGLILDDAEVRQGEVMGVFQRPFATGVSVDVAPPNVSSLAFDPHRRILAGVADDDAGITRLDVYDGPVLLATTDLEVSAALGIPEVRFPGGGTAFLASLDVTQGTYELSVTAFDLAGNESTEHLSISAP